MAKCAHFEVCGIAADTIPEGGHCILHAQDPDKDQEAFLEALECHLEKGTGDFRCMYFCGPTGFENRLFYEEVNFSEATFDGKIYFSEAEFRKGANFRGATFSKEAYFRAATFSEGSGARFRKGANFSEATFSKRADFRWTKFSEGSKAAFGRGADFHGATFSEGADFCGAKFSKVPGFSGATFRKGANFRGAAFRKGADFRGAMFSKGTNFYGAKFSKETSFSKATFGGRALFEGTPQHALFTDAEEVDFRDVTLDPLDAVAFRNADLRRCRFLNTDVREIEFTAVEWCRKPSRWFGGKGTVCTYDELCYEEDEKPWGRLERLYRELKQNYEDRRDYARAGDFHFREKEMRKRNPNTSLGHKGLLWAYWGLSGYGERVWPAVGWLSGMIFICATLYLAAGIAPGGYGSALLYSAQTSFLIRPDGYVLEKAAQWVRLVQTVASPILLGLIALAIRQRLKR